MMFGADIRAAFGVIEDLMNSSTSRGEAELLDEPRTLDELAVRHALSYEPGRTRAESIELRQLRMRLEEFFRSDSVGDRMALVNSLLLTAGSIPQLVTHVGDEIPHFHYTMEDATFSSKITAVAAVGLARLMSTETENRLRTCDGPGCNKVFIDVSKNGSRRYCDSQSCGNRLHAARYRARKSPSPRGGRTSEAVPAAAREAAVPAVTGSGTPSVP
jgi:predicted RNA-binding Zn ribbon-like protein